MLNLRWFSVVVNIIKSYKPVIVLIRWCFDPWVTLIGCFDCYTHSLVAKVKKLALVGLEKKDAMNRARWRVGVRKIADKVG